MTRETIPEIFERISKLEKLDDFKAQCLTMHMSLLSSLIVLADGAQHYLFAACLYERYADLLWQSASSVKIFYCKSSDYFYRCGYGFEGNRVMQKANALENVDAPTQPQNGASFFASAKSQSRDEKGRNNPYAPVFPEQ